MCPPPSPSVNRGRHVTVASPPLEDVNSKYFRERERVDVSLWDINILAGLLSNCTHPDLQGRMLVSTQGDIRTYFAWHSVSQSNSNFLKTQTCSVYLSGARTVVRHTSSYNYRYISLRVYIVMYIYIIIMRLTVLFCTNWFDRLSVSFDSSCQLYALQCYLLYIKGDHISRIL